MANTKEHTPGILDARIKITGPQADRLRKKLMEKKKVDKRMSLTDTVVAALFEHFDISVD